MRSKIAAIAAATALYAMTASAWAMPKAAEDIDAPVTVGADVARPKIAAKKHAASSKAVKASKPASATKASKATKPGKSAPHRKGSRIKA